jgi:hypothetical protein
MKNRFWQIIAVLLMVFISISALSQKKANIPKFRIGRTDKTYFSNPDLNKNMPVLLVYFQPDCDDCQEFIKALRMRAGDFKNVQVVMVTNTGLQQLVNFEKNFKLKDYKNFVVGTEGYTMLLQRALNVKRFPFAAAYNRRGELLTIFNGSQEVNALLTQMKFEFNRIK